MMQHRLRAVFNDATVGIRPSGWFNRSRGSLREFIEDEVPDDADGVEVIARILNFFCLQDDGSFNNVTQGILLALKFMTNLPGISCSEVERERFVKDLKALFDAPSNLGEIRKLVRAHFD